VDGELQEPPQDSTSAAKLIADWASSRGILSLAAVQVWRLSSPIRCSNLLLQWTLPVQSKSGIGRLRLPNLVAAKPPITLNRLAKVYLPRAKKRLSAPANSLAIEPYDRASAGNPFANSFRIDHASVLAFCQPSSAVSLTAHSLVPKATVIVAS
jgi:hypothetical protein